MGRFLWGLLTAGVFAGGPFPVDAAPRLDWFSPDVVRLNSTLVLRGQELDARGREVRVRLSGKWLSADGRKARDVDVVLRGRVVGPTEVRAPVTRAFVDTVGLEHAQFEGQVSILELEFAGVLRVGLRLFPPDVLEALVLLFGFRDETSTMPPMWTVLLAEVLLALFIVLAVFAPFAGVASWAERRVAGRMQNRIGPNRVGPQGILQWVADGLKAIQKEDFIPRGALTLLFRVGPYFAMIGVVLTLVTLPFGQFLVVADLNAGVYYVLAVTSFVVIGILAGGFASANKWALLGAFRSAAQVVSYEIPAGLAAGAIVITAGTLGFQSIIEQQGGWPWQWFLFHNPFSLAAFLVYFISALAEGNRTPFDLPEAESELVAGYNTEYSGMRFVFYMFAEWGNLYVIGALVTAMFLGGWQIPGVSAQDQAGSVPLIVLGWLIFTFKALFLVFVVMWLRWTLPRLRVDQLMHMCWKYLLPIGVFLFLGAGLWVTLVPRPIQTASSIVLFLAGVAMAAWFVRKLVRTLREGPYEVYPNPFV